MHVLLDEALPRRLKAHLAGHDVRTVAEVGWAGKKNGELLSLANDRFEVLLTVDSHLPAQQNLSGLRLAIVIVRARSNALRDLLPLVPSILGTLERIAPGQLVRVTTG